MVRPVLLGLSLGLVGCTGPTPLSEGSPGTLSVRWDGAEQGRFLALATGIWCPVDSMLEVTAIRGDTGVGLALFMSDTVRGAVHPVLSGDVKVDWRPLGGAALRWVAPADVVGYEGTGGVINVIAGNSAVSGTIDVRLRSLNGVDTLRMVGGFTDLSLVPAVAACGRADKGKRTTRDDVLP